MPKTISKNGCLAQAAGLSARFDELAFNLSLPIFDFPTDYITIRTMIGTYEVAKTCTNENL